MSAEKKIKFKSFALKLSASGLTMVAAGLLYFYCTPKSYVATAKVKILKGGWNNTNEANPSFAQGSLPAECASIRSESILDQTITNLNLNELWGKEFNHGTALKTEETRARLKSLLDVHPAPKSSGVVDIQATGSEPVELARLVNEVARLYYEFRRSLREQASHQGVNTLRARWESQNQRVQVAQASLDKLLYEINMDRATNQVQVYDPKDLESLQLKRLHLEDDYVKKKSQFDKLKSLGKDELKDVVSVMDNGANPLLTAALSDLIKAKASLRDAQTVHGADAAETKHAANEVDRLNHRVDELTGSIMAMKEADLASTKAMLDQMADMLGKASHATNSMQRFASQDTKYARAKHELDMLTQERDVLEREIAETGSMTAVMPDIISAEIVELADPPSKPASPDRRIALGVCILGGALTCTGLLLLVLLAMKPRGVEEKAV